MKVTHTVTINTSYNDGAGNSCLYGYTIANKAHTVLGSKWWKLRAFKVGLPVTNVTITSAGQLAPIVGAPPAANTRTMVIAPTGVVTLGANEALVDVSYVHKLALSEVEEHEVASMSMKLLSNATLITYAGTQGEWKSYALIAEGATKTLAATLNATSIAEKKLSPVAYMVAETDLVTREYNGSSLEGAMKLIVTGAQMFTGKYEGLIAQGAGYMNGGNSPLALDLPLSIHNNTMGVLS